MSRTIVVQIREYPHKKGSKSKSLSLKDHSVEAAATRIIDLYWRLEKEEHK